MLSDLPVKTILLSAAVALAALPLCAQHFSASDVPGLGIHREGKIVITITGTRPLAAPVYLSALINDAARAHGVDPKLVAAVAKRESAFNPAAVSRRGACGLMQLMPATARSFGVTDIFDPRQNVEAGVRYLRSLIDSFNGNVDLALAAYNAGPGAVQRYRGMPPFSETRAYVSAIRASYDSPHLSLRRSTSK